MITCIIMTENVLSNHATEGHGWQEIHKSYLPGGRSTSMIKLDWL